MKISSTLRDFYGAIRVISKRKKKFNKANDEEIKEDKIGALAKKLHPGKIELTLVDIRLSTKNSKILRFEGENIPYFKAGQYLTLEYDINNMHITRPYSIISSPKLALSDKPYVEICVGNYPDSISGKYLFNEAKINQKFIAEVGLGRFNYDSIRDSKNLVLIAGGMGVTPFLSILHMIKDNNLDLNATLIHGINSSDELILNDELNLLKGDNIKIVHVLNGNDDSWKEEKGLINKEIIQKYSYQDSTYFICGSNELYKYVNNELEKLNISKRRIRKEIYSKRNEIRENSFKLEVIRGINSVTIDCYNDESIASALERENIKIHTSCRSGICGLCRIRILSGDFYIDEENDNRRATDKEFNYVYACSCYPRSDLKIKINI